jgi:hypothetical protein
MYPCIYAYTYFSAYVLYNLYMQLDYIALEVLTEGLNMYQKASTYDRRSQLIIITGSVMLLGSIVSILVVRSNLSIKLCHPTTSLSRNHFVMQGNSWNCTTKYTKWTRCCIGEKWFLLQFQLFFTTYLEIWDKTTYRAHVCKFSSTDGLNRKLQIPFCLLNIWDHLVYQACM